MRLIEAIEEIQEKVDNFLTIESIVRKINVVRGQIVRKYQDEPVVYQMDLIKSVGMYPFPYPKDTIKEVLLEGVKWRFAQFNSLAGSNYYYFTAAGIGLYPAPIEDIPQGISIIHAKTLLPLSVDDLDAEVGIDPDYDMLAVYGVLKEITKGNESAEYTIKYENLLNDYLQATANGTPEAHQIRMEEW